MFNCAKCGNLGFYEMGFSDASGWKVSMFCLCEYGKIIRELTIELRLIDLTALAKEFIPKISEVKNNLANPTVAGDMLDKMKEDLKTIIEKTIKGLEEK